MRAMAQSRAHHNADATANQCHNPATDDELVEVPARLKHRGVLRSNRISARAAAIRVRGVRGRRRTRGRRGRPGTDGARE